MKKIKAAFFDRDGTLIHDVSYLSRLEDIKPIPEGLAIARLCLQAGYTLFVVTNQSGVARGFFDESFVHKTHDYLKNLFAEHDIIFEKYYFCPHYQQNCLCRKPNPGMLLLAAQEYNIDLASSLMFGDKAIDLEAGRAAGCKSFDITKLFTRSLSECAKLLES